MKLRTMLLASAAVMFAAGTASAADLTGAFYLPGEGKFASDTKLQYQRVEIKDVEYKHDSWRASEEITYGVTNDFAVFGRLGNDFDTEGYYNNDHNFDYEVGAAYNMRSGNVLTQVRGSYETYNPKDYWGKRNSHDRWQKYLKGEVRVGYDMGDGLTPYMTYGFDGQVDEADREFTQSAFAGVHKYAGDWALDGGVRYNFGTDGKNKNTVYAEAEADYYPVENVAVGVYGSYYLAGQGNDAELEGYPLEMDKDYTTGVRVKFEF